LAFPPSAVCGSSNPQPPLLLAPGRSESATPRARSTQRRQRRPPEELPRRFDDVLLQEPDRGLQLVAPSTSPGSAQARSTTDRRALPRTRAAPLLWRTTPSSALRRARPDPRSGPTNCASAHSPSAPERARKTEGHDPSAPSSVVPVPEIAPVLAISEAQKRHPCDCEKRLPGRCRAWRRPPAVTRRGQLRAAA
jgi:hypothetical protein